MVYSPFVNHNLKNAHRALKSMACTLCTLLESPTKNLFYMS